MESAKAKVYVKKVSSAKTLAVTLLLLTGTLLAGCGDTLNPTVEELQIGSETLPVYRITKSGATAEEARTLADAAGLEVERVVDEHGVVDFFDPKRYQFIPTQTLGRGEPDEDGQATTLEAFDFEALEALQVPEGDEMQALLTEALTASGLLPGEPFDIEPTVQHSTFVAADEGGEAFLEQRLDTRVSYRASLNGLQVGDHQREFRYPWRHQVALCVPPARGRRRGRGRLAERGASALPRRAHRCQLRRGGRSR